ncbi:hypothetical protein FRB96_008736 [Tulasnella sp. 330]|nr:hypothetical protein FRB96_008736 [Tulasnella sp. 330]KAG8875887.1 hypothetical protein FRB97_004656 [Tulasnella sp. 331]KAG8876198.1 hypothetical protein FRB98_007392 [Tulasnella sp. 332]
MRDVLQTETVVIPKGVTATVDARIITIKGPRGELVRDLHHISMDIRLISNAKKADKLPIIHLAVWNGVRKHVACLRTIKSSILNMIKGVTQGFLYKMRLVYAHFPINCIIQEEGRAVEIRNFLGEKIVRRVAMLPGVEIIESKAQKDELILQGNDINNVSQSAASIKGSCLVRNKDIRKFLDGIYVSEKTVVDEIKTEE